MKIYIGAAYDRELYDDDDRWQNRYTREITSEEVEYTDNIVLDVYTRIEVSDRGEWEDLNDYSWAYPSDTEDEWYNEDGVLLDYSDVIIDNVAKLLTPHLPYDQGVYNVHFVATLPYEIENVIEYSDGTTDYSDASSYYKRKDAKIEDIIVSRYRI